MTRIALLDFVGSFLQLIWRAEGAREEETPLRPILLRGWVEKHEEVSAGCRLALHVSLQKGKMSLLLLWETIQWVLKGIITGLIVVCFNAVICFLCNIWTELELQSHSALVDFCAVWLNNIWVCFHCRKPHKSTKCLYRSMWTVFPSICCLLTGLQILLNELGEFVERLLLVQPVRASAASKREASVVVLLRPGFRALFYSSLNTFLTQHIEIILFWRLILWIYLSGRIPS